MNRSELKVGAKSLARGSTFATRGGPLQRKATPRHVAMISPASKAQRKKVAGQRCLVCGREFPAPAHLIARGFTTEGQDDPRAVVPLCWEHHREYDTGVLDLLPHLEPYWRVELAFAVERVGLVATVRRVTNDWAAVGCLR